jgi:3-hydroxyisobutyrate dehydrogenase
MAQHQLPPLAFLGTGLMGRPMAARLVAAGYTVSVWNRTADRARPLAGLGARIAADPAEAIRTSDAVVLMLSDATAIHETLLAGAARDLVTGRSVIQMGTIAPSESVALAAEVVRLGGEYLEAPVLGSIPEAESGRLLVMAGAELELFERWLAVLEVFGSRPRLVGPPGRAASLKLALNQLIATITSAYAVGLGIVRRSGIEVELWADIVRSSALYAPTFDKKLSAMVERSFSPANFPARHLLKDVRLAAAEAARVNLYAPHLAGLEEILVRTVEAGLGDSDYSALAAAIDPRDTPSRPGSR